MRRWLTVLLTAATMLAGAVARAGAPGPWPFKLVPPLRARYTVEARVRGLVEAALG